MKEILSKDCHSLMKKSSGKELTGKVPILTKGSSVSNMSNSPSHDLRRLSLYRGVRYAFSTYNTARALYYT